MKKYAKIINKETKEVSVFLGIDIDWAVLNGFSEMDVEQAYDSSWYVAGYCPTEPEKTYAEKRLAEYPAISDQLDMIYWDKVNGTNLWQEKIAEIKAKYPKARVVSVCNTFSLNLGVVLLDSKPLGI